MSITTVLFSFDGRIDRSTYWLQGYLPLAGLSLVFIVLLSLVQLIEPLLQIPLLLAAVSSLTWGHFAVSAKRCHDFDKSGWWGLLAALIPIGFIVLGVMEGTDGDNGYGPKPGDAREEHETRRIRAVSGRIIFTGSFWHYSFKGILISVLMLILSPFTLGLSLMYIPYWNVEYFFANMEIEAPQPQPGAGSDLRQRRGRIIFTGNFWQRRGRIIFTGNFWRYSFKGILISVLMLILSPFTLGLSLMYILYWNVEYFYANMQVEMPQPQPGASNGPM